MSSRIAFKLNGLPAVAQVDDPSMPLLYALRDQFKLHGPRYGCGLGQCGSCTVHIEGQAVRSCMTPVSSIEGKTITTLEGLGNPDAGKLHALQAAFIEEQAAQCGYCTNGMIMQAADLLQRNAKPSEEEIRTALAGNLCRCGSQARVLRAVKRASGQVKG
jgi:nicotinate dehydrogenase subunit A